MLDLASWWGAGEWSAAEQSIQSSPRNLHTAGLRSKQESLKSSFESPGQSCNHAPIRKSG